MSDQFQNEAPSSPPTQRYDPPQRASPPPAPQKSNRIHDLIEEHFPDDPAHGKDSIYSRTRRTLLAIADAL